MTTDAAGFIVAASNRAAAVLGAPVERLLGRPMTAVLRVIEPGDSDVVVAIIEELRDAPAGARSRRTVTIANDAGVAAPLTLLATAITDGDGRLDGLTMVFEDGADRERRAAAAERDALGGQIEALQQAESRLRSYLEHSPIAVVAMDANGRIVDANSAAGRLFRCEPAGLLGLPALALHAPETREEVAGLLRTVAAKGRANGEVRAAFRDGSGWCWVEVNLGLLPDGGALAYIEDISARKASDVALRQSEDRFSKAFHRSPIAKVIVRFADGEIVEVNDAFVRLSGYTRNELIGFTAVSLGLVDQAQRQSFIDALQSQGVVHDFEGRLRTRAGDERQTVTSAALVVFGSLPHIAITLLDVTEQRRTEAELRDLNARFHKLFDASPVALTVKDMNGRFVEVNAAFLRETGFSAAEVLGRTVDDLHLFEPSRGMNRVIRQVQGGGTAQDVELAFRTRSGEARRALFYADTVSLNGAPHIVTTSIDVTDRRRAEEALRETNARFREMAEAIEEAFWLREVDYSKYLYISPAFETIFGIHPDDLRRNPLAFRDIIHEDDRDRVFSFGKQADRWPGEIEYRIVRRDGEVRWIRSRLFPVQNEAGVVVRVAGTSEDITGRRQLEAQLRQTQKMESIGLLAGGVAHDFNNLLTVIMGFADMAADAIEDRPDVLAALDEVRAASDQAAALTRQLLAFSRKETAEAGIHDLNGVVLDTSKMLRRVLGEDVRLETDLVPTPTCIRADRDHCVQVLMNLCVNARDAMPTGGSVTVGTAIADVDRESRPTVKAGRYVRLSVSDTGCGMSPQVVSRIFEPFFTTKAADRGTGLGLSVVHGIVRQAGGFIDVESVPHKGTTFAVYWPLAQDCDSGIFDTSQEARVGGSERVLLVEDDDMLRDLAQSSLTRYGYTVMSASNAPEALSALEHTNAGVDLVLTDVVLPGMDGRQLAEAVADRWPAVRFLYTSGHPEETLMRRGIRLRDLPFLAKPYTTSELLKQVRTALVGS